MPGKNKAAPRAQFKMPFEMPGYYVYVVSEHTSQIVFDSGMVAVSPVNHGELSKHFRAGEAQNFFVYNYDLKKTFGPFPALGPPVRALSVYLRDLKYVQ